MSTPTESKTTLFLRVVVELLLIFKKLRLQIEFDYIHSSEFFIFFQKLRLQIEYNYYSSATTTRRKRVV